jgi:hypothetical protein
MEISKMMIRCCLLSVADLPTLPDQPSQEKKLKLKLIHGLMLSLACSAIVTVGANASPLIASAQAATTVTCYAAWDASVAYTGGATVSYNGVNYKANWWTQGNNPSTNNGGSGSGQPWTIVANCGGTVTPPPPPPPPPGGGTTPAGFVFSPYKDGNINLNWNTYAMSTAVTGSTQTVLSAMPAKLATLTWAFATGACGSENWGGVSASAFAAANVQAFVNAGKKYIVSTGGAAGSFTCTSDADFLKFIQTYYSANLVGIDFDIEAGQTQADINNLVLRVKTAQATYPNLRFSFTLATLGGNVSPSLGYYGVEVMQAIQAYGLSNYTINLMAMDYGSPAGGNCMTKSDGSCDMGASAVQSAIDLHTQYNLPYKQIEVTPMIGGNDSANETFSIADVATLVNFAQQNGLAGIHYWSFDRDRDCAPGSASPTCNTYGTAGTLGFTNAFISSLGL